MNHTILFADSDQELCYLYERLLTQKGFQVETAEGGVECLATLQQLRPDVLVLELELLWGGGDGVLAIMEKEKALRSIPVILISNGTGREAVPRKIRDAVFHHLEKPFELGELLLHIHTATALNRLAKVEFA